MWERERSSFFKSLEHVMFHRLTVKHQKLVSRMGNLIITHKSKDIKKANVKPCDRTEFGFVFINSLHFTKTTAMDVLDLKLSEKLYFE